MEEEVELVGIMAVEPRPPPFFDLMKLPALATNPPSLCDDDVVVVLVACG